MCIFFVSFIEFFWWRFSKKKSEIILNEIESKQKKKKIYIYSKLNNFCVFFLSLLSKFFGGVFEKNFERLSKKIVRKKKEYNFIQEYRNDFCVFLLILFFVKFFNYSTIFVF